MITIVELVKFREGRYGKHARKTRNSVSEMIATVFASGSFPRCAPAMQDTCLILQPLPGRWQLVFVYS